MSPWLVLDLGGIVDRNPAVGEMGPWLELGLGCVGEVTAGIVLEDGKGKRSDSR